MSEEQKQSDVMGMAHWMALWQLWPFLQRWGNDLLYRLPTANSMSAFRLLNASLATVFKADGTGEVFPDHEATWGLWSRVVNRLGIGVYTDHFRSGAIPTGFSWISDGTFNGTPTTLAYALLGTHLAAAANATPHFLADAITTYSGKVLAARLSTGATTEIGLRVDDGTDDNYAEAVLDPDDVGGYHVDFRCRAGGGEITDVQGPYYAATEFVTVQLLHIPATPSLGGYTVGEAAQSVNLTGFNTGAIEWTPARVGFVARVNGGNYGLVDWFYSTFG